MNETKGYSFRGYSQPKEDAIEFASAPILAWSGHCAGLSLLCREFAKRKILQKYNQNLCLASDIFALLSAGLFNCGIVSYFGSMSYADAMYVTNHEDGSQEFLEKGNPKRRPCFDVWEKCGEFVLETYQNSKKWNKIVRFASYFF